ncbi:hypothetical protein [Paenibacillus sp. SI8]|uniref:hypothetical protein n=1 Tax=unclassified Paenibacillus TaxID=185978 RepID=UPI0034651373
MLKTELLEIQMDEQAQLFELKLGGQTRHESLTVRLNQADLIQLMHTLLEINRIFRGDVPYFSCTERVLEHAVT